MNIDHLAIEQTLPALSCDYEGLKSWATAMTAKYENLVITESEVKDIKVDMAELNKAKQKLDRARIDAVKAVSAPIREFEGQIKEICGIFDKTYRALGEQVKGFEAKEREEKRAKVQTIADRYLANALKDYPRFEGKLGVTIEERWLNKTITLKKVEEEIVNILDGQIKLGLAIEARKKAQSERRLLIEKAVMAGNERLGINLPVSEFMCAPYTDLELDGVTVLSKINGLMEMRQKVVQVDVGEMKKYEANNPPISDKVANEGLRIKVGPKIKFYMGNESRFIKLEISYTEEQTETVRQILEQNQFMRIVRQLRGAGIDTNYERG